MCKNEKDTDIIKIREGCCCYTLYDRIEDQVEMPKKKAERKLQEKQKTVTNHNLAITELELQQRLENEKYVETQASKDMLLIQKAQKTIENNS